MSDKSAKDIRKQLRNVVQDAMPQIVTEELGKAVHDALKSHIDKRLDAISKHIQTSLDALDQRSKDVQAFVIRQNTAQAPAPKE